MISNIPASANFVDYALKGGWGGKDVNVLLNLVLTKMSEYFGVLSGGRGGARSRFLFVF